jgi:hypothetical protein
MRREAQSREPAAFDLTRCARYAQREGSLIRCALPHRRSWLTKHLRRENQNNLQFMKAAACAARNSLRVTAAHARCCVSALRNPAPFGWAIFRASDSPSSQARHVASSPSGSEGTRILRALRHPRVCRTRRSPRCRRRTTATFSIPTPCAPVCSRRNAWGVLITTPALPRAAKGEPLPYLSWRTATHPTQSAEAGQPCGMTARAGTSRHGASPLAIAPSMGRGLG